MTNKLISGQELVKRSPLFFKIKEVAIDGEELYQLYDNRLDKAIIYEAKKAETEPFTEKMFFMGSQHPNEILAVLL
ncbi:hypothetical protein [Runella limosa]|uniref:hypothetical protein n=1 Tax=Runella limosa TaxID=370978 RepID=UPI000422A1CD|nr:hypothetical protein [Runella limosa]